MRPPTAAARLSGSPAGAVHRRPARGRPAAGGPGCPGALPLRRWLAGPLCPLGRATRRPQHHHGRRRGRGAERGAGGRLHRQVRDQGHRELRAGWTTPSEDDLDHLDKLPAHVGELVRAAWELGGRPELEGLRLRRGRTCWGSAGIGRPRAAATPPPSLSSGGPGSRSPSGGGPATACPWMPGGGPRTTRPWSWSPPGCVGSGYATEGERWLALSAAARAREQRAVAREELRTMPAA